MKRDVLIEEMITRKCHICGNNIEYHQGNPDFMSCVNFRTCGRKLSPAPSTIDWLSNYISFLEHKEKEN